MASEDRLRQRMVHGLRKQGLLRDERVAAAFAAAPRHVFVPKATKKAAYSNQAIITKTLDGVPVSSSSEPAIMAVMLEQLRVEPGQRVLEIGAGTGYNAALLAELTGPKGSVTTVDIDRDIAEDAAQHLRAAGYRRARALCADGGYGHPPGAPYDRIIATCSCWQVPQPWVDQLVDGGLLVLPLRINGVHLSVALWKDGQRLVSTSASICGFMPMRGAFGPAHTQLVANGTRVAADIELSAATRKALARTLSVEQRVRLRYPRLRHHRNSPVYYLALQGKLMLNLFRDFGSWGALPFGLVASPRSVVALPWHRPARGRVALFGQSEALDLAEQLLRRWEAEGRPDPRELRMRVTPSRAAIGPLPRPTGDGRYRFRRGTHLYELWYER